MIRMYGCSQVRKVYGLLVQLNFSQLHVYVHAVRFELFYNCTPIMQVEYELNTHLETRIHMCPVYESHTLTTLLIPHHVCFNSAMTIYRSSIFCAHEST